MIFNFSPSDPKLSPKPRSGDEKVASPSSPRPPDRQPSSSLRNQEEVCDAINVARQTGDHQQLLKFFTTMYSSFEEVLKVLRSKKTKESPSSSSSGESSSATLNLNTDYLDYLHESMIRMPKVRSYFNHLYGDL